MQESAGTTTGTVPRPTGSQSSTCAPHWAGNAASQVTALALRERFHGSPTRSLKQPNRSAYPTTTPRTHQPRAPLDQTRKKETRLNPRARSMARAGSGKGARVKRILRCRAGCLATNARLLAGRLLVCDLPCPTCCGVAAHLYLYFFFRIVMPPGNFASSRASAPVRPFRVPLQTTVFVPDADVTTS